MLSKIEDISATKKRLFIEIPADAIEEEIRDSLNKVRARTRLPGFRPGKAPSALIEKRFGKDVEAEVLDRIIPRYYSDAVKEAKLNPVSMPRMEEQLDFKRNQPLMLNLLVEVRPEIEGLSYEGVKVTTIPAEVNDSDIEDTLTRLQQEKAQYEPSEGPIKDGDLVVMDFDAGEKTYKDEVVRIGGGIMPQVFSEKLLGLKKGDPAEFEAEFPEGYHVPELAGGKHLLKVSVKDIKNVNLPDIDDEFAKDLEFENMEALRAKIREGITERKRGTAEKIMKAEVLKKLLDAHEFEAPESLVEQEVSHLVANARGSGRTEDEEALRLELLPAAQRNIRATMMLQAIAEKEGIEVADEDVRQRVRAVAVHSGLSEENVMKYYISRDGSLEGLRHSVLEEKVLDFLFERAEKVEEQEK